MKLKKVDKKRLSLCANLRYAKVLLANLIERSSND